MVKQHFRWIDTAKGIGIILVVFGHAIADTTSEIPIFNKIFWFIYSFHMPLFFFLSGFCGAKALETFTKDEKAKYIIGRFKRLMIPYFFIGCVYIPIKLVMADYVTSTVSIQTAIKDMLLGSNPNSQLWTLYALFLSAIFISIFAVKTRGDYQLGLLIVAVICGIVSISLPSGVLQNILGEFPFYVLGVIARKNNFQRLLNGKIAAVSVVIFIGINIISKIHNDSILKFATGITGILVISYLSKKISEIFKATSIEVLGKYSMDIYIIANMVQVLIRIVMLNKLAISPIIYCFGSTIFGVLIPVIISKYLIRRLKISRALILGDFK